LVAIACSDVTLARAFASYHIAALIVNGAQSVAGAGYNFKIIHFFHMILENSLSGVSLIFIKKRLDLLNSIRRV